MALGGSCQAPSGHLVLKMVTTMLCFHSDGTVPREKRSSNKFSKAACHHGDKTLKSEYGKPLSPTIELHTSGQAQWSSADVNGAPEAPSTGAHAGNSFEAAHGCFKRESSNELEDCAPAFMKCWRQCANASRWEEAGQRTQLVWSRLECT